MKSDNPTIDTLVVITNRQLLQEKMSIQEYGKALSLAIDRIQKYRRDTIQYQMGVHTSSVRGLEDSTWMGQHSNLYTLCRDTDIPFEEYLQLCDAIGSTVVYHGKVITNREELGIVLERAKRIHMPSNLLRYWQSEKRELWEALQQQWNTLTLWSTVHDEKDIQLLTSLPIPKLESILISPIFPTLCKEGHPGIGVSRGEELLQQMQTHYPHVKGIALGGIHEDNYQQCLQHSFNGVAVMSDFMKLVVTTGV